MPRTRSLAWSELKIGIMAVTAIGIAATLIFMIGGQAGFPWQRYHLKTRFPDVKGLKTGAVVRVAGVEVGKVTAVEFQGPQVEILMELRKEMQDKVTDASRASIGSVSLLGEPVIDITASAQGRPLPDWGFVRPGRAAGQITEVAETANRSLEEATRLIQDVREGRGTVGKLFTDEALYREIRRLVEAAGDVASSLQHGEGTVGRLLRDPAAYRSLESALTSLDAVLKRINTGEGSLGRLVQDEAFARSVTSASNNLDALMTKLNRGEGSAAKLVNDPQLYNRLNSLADRLDQVAARLTQGQGTAGQLLHDKQLYENMNGAASEIRSLVSDIRKDPKKYLHVRVSIF